MTDLKINVLGGLEIAGSGAKPLTRKAKAVAAYLALRRGQPQSREKVAAMFWENSPEEQARTNLRQCLSTLRKHFDTALITGSDAISLDPAAVEVDANRFEELIGSEDHEAIEAAVALYKGDLLEGFGLKEEAFEAWIRSERERFRTEFVDGLVRLIDRCEASKGTGAVVKFATRLLALDPLIEKAHRSLMSAYASQGRHDAALKQFEVCRDVLDRELGVPPQPETVALRNRLRSDRKSRGESQNANAPLANFASDLDALGIDISRPSKPSIILMPFKDLSANGELSHFAEGIRIDMQCALVKISGLFVIAAGTAAVYADRPSRPEQVSQEMGVRHVLEGSIQRIAEHIRVTAQLTDGLSGQVVWSERYDRKLDSSFLVQDEIVERIVTSLDVKLVSGEQAKVWRKTIRHPKALELYYKGLEILNNFDKQNVAAARQLFEKVTEISPGVTLGPTLVAFCHYWDVTMGWSADPGEALGQAAEWSQRAAAMEDADGQAHAILAHVKLLQGKHEEALEIAEEAIRIRPLCANTNALSGNILLYCGRPRESIERVKSAIRIAPVYASWWVEILATAYRDAGQNELAIAAANELLRKNPESTNALLILASALVAKNRLEAAKSHAAKVLALDPEFSLSRYAAQHPYQNQEPFRRHLANLRKAGLPK
ncbi:MAG: BTAD domain-containing putative transcriptional regulator [Alphaproteobacteria bacterium]